MKIIVFYSNYTKSLQIYQWSYKIVQQLESKYFKEILQ